MQNPDVPNSIESPQTELQAESLDTNIPSFPFLTKLWLKGNAIAITLGAIAILASVTLFGSKAGTNPVSIFAGFFLGAVYAFMIWFFVKLYSETAGVFLNIEESTRITADILSRMETKQSGADVGKGITERT